MKLFLIKSITLMLLSINSSFAYDPELPDSNNSRNIIHLIGENHKDLECANFKIELSRKASNNDIVLALEGQPFDQKISDNIFGIEEKNTYRLTSSFDFYLQIAIYKIASSLDPSKAKTMSLEILFNLYFSPPSSCLDDMFDILNDLDSNLKIIHKKHPKIIQEFVNIRKLKSSPADHKKKIIQLTKHHSFDEPFFLKMNPDISLWFNLFKDITTLYTKEALLKTEQTSSSPILFEIASYISKIQEYANLDAEEINRSYGPVLLDLINLHEVLHTKVTCKLRNQIFLNNIINIFENNKSQQKPFYIIIGAAHTPFLYQELVKRGYEVKMNNRAQQHYDKHLLESASSSKAEL